ncbi:hypothetical protein O3M35_007393 [Rhynocoris fuscipes]|uniref:Uncharacterized protein n=2 Tax=Rhynocoris fuscipes TaxID=488301 RepID=A0AAW1DCW9_9HEMI
MKNRIASVMYEESEVPSEIELLLRSTLFHDLEGVKNALDMNADVNGSGPDLVTALHIACEKGYSEVVNFLVTVPGINLNLCTVYRNTPLLLSVYHNHFKVTCILLRAGADPNALAIFEQTALHVAAFHGRLKSVQKLIKYKADVNVVDCFERSPLYLSLISHPSPTITYFLLKAGADPNFLCNLDLSLPLLGMAVLGAHSRPQLQAIATLIYFGANLNEKDLKGDTSLHKAALTGYTPVINLLVKNDANLFEKNMWNETPLDVAKLHKNVGATVLLEDLEDEQIYQEFTLLNWSSSTVL